MGKSKIVTTKSIEVEFDTTNGHSAAWRLVIEKEKGRVYISLLWRNNEHASYQESLTVAQFKRLIDGLEL